jgi:hypothetical protein
MGPTQLPLHWVSGALSPGSSDWDIKLTTHLLLVPRLGMEELNILSPIYLCSMMLIQLSTGTPLLHFTLL